MDNVIGYKISALRKELGMTQQQLASKSGINSSSIVKIENAQQAISIGEGKAISKALGISLKTLLFNGFEKIPSDSFVKAFESKGLSDKDLEEVSKLELLFDALLVQREIYQLGV